ncbi:kinase-like protein [Westerdykella ornata]|uniref:Kinase-like protein n=1 Tax=Westerdykella ornata TaxID=318751 RepID=A0A6A6J6X4_WESOR|nr:kinase-like protein [Westerdykella ornata]KAF2271386.1 kinase-like protein [Westerdykella ornata]
MNPEKNTANTALQLPDDLFIIDGKGEFIAGGTTSLVERLPSGDIIKTPWAGDIREEDCRREIAIEAQIYQRLGEHPRLVKLKGWDPEAHTLTLEYMPNGTLEEYLKSHHEEISPEQRLCWIAQAAEGLHLLHSAGIIHCDVGPHNLLLDADLSLKIADFSGSSLDGSRAMVCPGARYMAPDPDWKPGKPPSVEEDLFALGSTIYYIVMGKAPFDDLPDGEVEKRYLNGEFPDLAGVPCRRIIELCWRQEARSAELIRDLVDKLDPHGDSRISTA